MAARMYFGSDIILQKENMLLLFFIIAITTALLSHLKRDKTFEELALVYADGHSRFYKWKGIDVHFKDEGRGMPIA